MKACLFIPLSHYSISLSGNSPRCNLSHCLSEHTYKHTHTHTHTHTHFYPMDPKSGLFCNLLLSFNLSGASFVSHHTWVMPTEICHILFNVCKEYGRTLRWNLPSLPLHFSPVPTLPLSPVLV